MEALKRPWWQLSTLFQICKGTANQESSLHLMLTSWLLPTRNWKHSRRFIGGFLNQRRSRRKRRPGRNEIIAPFRRGSKRGRTGRSANMLWPVRPTETKVADCWFTLNLRTSGLRKTEKIMASRNHYKGLINLLRMRTAGRFSFAFRDSIKWNIKQSVFGNNGERTEPLPKRIFVSIPGK